MGGGRLHVVRQVAEQGEERSGADGDRAGRALQAGFELIVPELRVSVANTLPPAERRPSSVVPRRRPSVRRSRATASVTRRNSARSALVAERALERWLIRLKRSWATTEKSNPLSNIRNTGRMSKGMSSSLENSRPSSGL
jgi:hypothetical protein